MRGALRPQSKPALHDGRASQDPRGSHRKIPLGKTVGEIHVGFHVGKCGEEIIKCGKSMEHVEKSSLYIVYERLLCDKDSDTKESNL